MVRTKKMKGWKQFCTNSRSILLGRYFYLLDGVGEDPLVEMVQPYLPVHLKRCS